MGSRSTIEDAHIFRGIMDQMRFRVGYLADVAQSITAKHPQVLSCTPTATRVITLPAVTAADDGKFFIINNGAAATYNLTINNSAASGIGTIQPLNAALVICISGAWVVRLAGTST